MAYSDFTLEDLREKFGINNHVQMLFEPLLPMEPSEFLKDQFEHVRGLPIRTEKAKSEGIVFPLLLELRARNNKFFTFYSGDNLNVDEQRGLKGECDFILAKDIGSFDLNYPIIQVVEAKKNDLEIGVPQCAAQMVGAKVFNEKKGVQIEKIYGCVTTGDEWLFMKLEGDLFIDDRKYYLNEISELLAVFQSIIDYYKVVLK
jgi:hypothetical protein